MPIETAARWDLQDLPSLAFPTFPGAPDGSLGATLRQTLLGIDATGPKVFGAHTSANAEIDFAGGSPTTSYGVASGLLSFADRTDQLGLGRKSSLHIGQDAPLLFAVVPDLLRNHGGACAGVVRQSLGVDSAD